MATAEATRQRLRAWCDTLPDQREGREQATVRLTSQGDGEWRTVEPPSSDVQHMRLEELPVLLEEAERRELEVLEPLGEGGMANITLAEQLPLDREVALKRARGQSGPTGDTRDPVTMLLHEAWVTGKLEHPNIVPVYRLGRDEDGSPIIVMKRIEGVTWRELMEGAEHPGGDQGDPLDLGLDILVEVCQAVEYAHDHGILHRDIKPDNVMVGAFGEVYVLDWGLAVGLDEDPEGRIPSLAEVSTPAGTPGYMAPEMVGEDVGELGVHTDVYLLGAVLYEMLTGDPPHLGETAFEMMMHAWESEGPEFKEDVPQRLAAICRRAMAKLPDERFESVGQMRRELVDFQRHRESLQMVERARERLTDFREMIERGRADGDVDSTELHEVFAECRFGFEQALEIDSGNQAARDGLQVLLSKMAAWEIDQGGYQAASMLINDLPQPDPDLEEALAELEREIESREKDVQELREVKREHDVERGRAARSVFVLKLGLFWTLFASLPFAAEWMLATDFGKAAHLLQSALIGLFIASGIYIYREDMFQNIANQKMVMTVVITYLLELGARIVGIHNGLPMQLILSFEGFMSALGTGVLALTIDERIFWASGIFALGSLAGGLLPQYALIINGSMTLLAMGSLALAWAPLGED
jgi:serine/threonine-protein kinase